MLTYVNREIMISSLVDKNGVYAEVGVFQGVFSNFICQTLSPKKFFVVDLFTGITGSGDQDGNNFQYCNLDDIYSKMIKDSNFTVMKGDSSTCISKLEDDFLDMIYLDGDHSYEGVKRDIDVAFKKVKNGGWLMGHDYEMNMKKARKYYQFGVKNAVDEFCKNNNQKIYAKGVDGCVSFAIKISK